MTARTKDDATPLNGPTLPRLDDEARAMLAAFGPVVEAHLDDLVADFLDYLTAWPEMAALNSTPEDAARLRETEGRHLLNLFSGTFDEGYFARVGRMREAHDRVGLEPRWYLGAYGHILKRLVELAIETCGDDAQRLLATVSAINRVVEIDMAYAVAGLEANPNAKTATPDPAQPGVDGVSGITRAILSPKAERASGR